MRPVQTGAGKTYTLSSIQPDAIGMMPRAAAEVFSDIANDAVHEYSVTMSYIQIYMELIQVRQRAVQALAEKSVLRIMTHMKISTQLCLNQISVLLHAIKFGLGSLLHYLTVCKSDRVHNSGPMRRTCCARRTTTCRSARARRACMWRACTRRRWPAWRPACTCCSSATATGLIPANNHMSCAAC